MSLLTRLTAHIHVVIGLAKYLLLLLFGWNIQSIVGPGWLVGLGVGLFVLFDLCAISLWFLMRHQKDKHTIYQLIVFYVIQVLAVSILWIVVFKPSLLADGVGAIAERVFR
jgi:hypothetical protein